MLHEANTGFLTFCSGPVWGGRANLLRSYCMLCTISETSHTLMYNSVRDPMIIVLILQMRKLRYGKLK